MHVHALAQSRARGNDTKTQCANEKCIAPKVLDSVKVALAQTQKGQVGFEDVAVGHARAHGELRIDQCINVEALEVFADKSQSGMGAEIVGSFFMKKSVMFGYTLRM
jgi:hypothetical protein